jgi:hypothetical protein
MKLILKQLYIEYLNLYSKLNYFLFLNKSSKNYDKRILQHNAKESKIDIVTIAYNNSMVIEYQILLLRKYLTDDFTHIVADNSSDQEIRNEIYEICKKLEVSYVCIPKNNLKRNKSHGAAMHWVYKNILRKRDNEYFGFIDHDIFPSKPYSIIEKMQKKIYGRVIHASYSDNFLEEHPYWSLWAGFYFLKSDLLYNENIYKFDFNPKYFDGDFYLDTGGGLWSPLMSKLPYPGELVKLSRVKFRDSEDSKIQTDYYELLDDWVHFVNISDWYKTPNLDQKINFIENFLTNCINQK